MNLINVLDLRNEISKAMISKVETIWDKEGKVQKKGTKNENRIADLLYLFNNIKVEKSPESSVADEVLKIDIILTIEDPSYPTEMFLLQIKSSEEGKEKHYSKNSKNILWNNVNYPCPYCIVVGKKTNEELFEELAELFCLETDLDFNKLENIKALVNKSVNERIPIKGNELNRKERKALRLFYKISSNGKTYFIK